MGKLNFTSIMVRKAPGFRNGLRVDGLDKLSPDINIIAGPNGSGKSTLARIIQRLLWPEREKGLDIEGAYEMEGYPWMVRLDSSALNIQKNGIDTLPAGIPSEDMKKVYMLALHDLITENDEDLARKILETSIGGFDLDKAKDNLKYSRDIKNRRAEAYIRYKTANEKSNEIIRKQSELKEQEGSLLQLEAEKNEAMFAVGLKDLYEKAEAYLLAKQELNRAEAALCVYPEVLNEAAGNEFEQIKQLEEDIAREETDIGNYNNEIAEKEETINGLAGPKEGIDDSVISELKLRINNISELEKRISECNLRIKKLEVQAEEAKKNIGGIQDPEKWAGITLESLGNLDQFFQEALTVMQQKISVVAEIQRLRQEAIEFTHIAEKLRKGISILGDWLKEQKLMKGIPTWITILISCLGILTSVAIWLAGPVGLSGIGLIVILLLYAFLAGRSDRSDSKLIYRQDDYKTTGLPEPEKWYAADVTARLQELINALHDEAQAEAREKIREGQLKTNEEALERLKTREKEINGVKEKLLNTLNAIPDFPKNAGETLSFLYIFLDELKKWQCAYEELISESNVLEELANQRDAWLEIINQHLSKIGAGIANDVTTALAIFGKVEGSEKERREAKRTIKELSKNIAESKKRVDSLRERVQLLYKKLGLEDGKIDEARKIMEDFPDFKTASKEKERAEANLKIREDELKKHSLYSDHEEELKNLQIYNLASKTAELRAKADRFVELNNTIIRIETQVDQKKSGAELEEALTARKNAENELEALYKKNVSSITGALLLELLKKETSDTNRPEVFKRADNILKRITKGRYGLRVTDSDNGPIFKAFDSVLNDGLMLNELSSGTRVQLLLSVRLAFIELQETGIKLPILADELMANSDDARAKAIIDALSEICREGRQVFYFSAQPDEVGKWDSFLKGRKDINYKVIIMGGVAEESKQYKVQKPDPGRVSFVRTFPAPGKMSVHEYRKLLGIPDYILITDKSSQLSISFLTDNANLIFNCLRTGVGTWGQLSDFYYANGKIEGLNDKVIKNMEKKVLLLESFQELYKIGRSHPIDMDVIAESGAVTDRFIDAVREKLSEVKGDALKLLDSLEHIPKFRQNSISQLKDYLLENKYIDDNKPLEEEEIVVLLQAQISNMEISRDEAQKFINGIIS